MSFRIAIGSMDCSIINDYDKIGQKIKTLLIEKIAFLKSKDFQLLGKLSDHNIIEHEIENRSVEIACIKEFLDEDKILIVVRAAYRTFNMPTYFTWGFVGRVYVKAFIVNRKNEYFIPNNDLLWRFK